MTKAAMQEALVALNAMLTACRENPSMQSRKYVDLGITVHKAIASLRAALSEQQPAAMPDDDDLSDLFPMADEFTAGVNAAAAYIDKLADNYSTEHGMEDPDTGVMEFKRGAKEDYYNGLRELADEVRAIVLDNVGGA